MYANMEHYLSGEQIRDDAVAVIEATEGVADGIATLDADGKLTGTQVPNISITDTYVVASEVAQLALTPIQIGDVAIRTDENKCYINTTGSNASMADWQELLTPTDLVLSVAGKVGHVTLVAADLTDVTSTATELNYTDGVSAPIQTQLNSKIGSIVADSTPQLGGNLDTNGYTISGADVGVEWTYNQTSSALARIDLQGDTIAPTATMFAHHPVYANIRRCNLADDSTYDDYTVNAWYGDTGFAYDGSNGQVMVWVPKFYDYEEHHAGDSKYRWIVSPTQRPGMTVNPAFVYDGKEMPGFFIGAFPACAYDISGSVYNTTDAAGVDYTATTGDKLSSVSGALPLSGNNNATNTMTNMRVLAQNRGAGWELQNYNQVAALQKLYLIRYADFNIQTKISEGVTDLASGSGNQALPSGYTAGVGAGSSDLGNVTGEVTPITHPTTAEVTQAFSLFGIENWPTGNIWEWVDGINIKADNNPWIADNGFADDTFTAPYVDTGLTLAAINGYTKGIALNPTQRFGFLITDTVGGSSSTYLTDNYYQTTGNRAALLGGYWHYGADAGAFCWFLSYAASTVDRAVGSRLAFLPHE